MNDSDRDDNGNDVALIEEIRCIMLACMEQNSLEQDDSVE